MTTRFAATRTGHFRGITPGYQVTVVSNRVVRRVLPAAPVGGSDARHAVHGGQPQPEPDRSQRQNTATITRSSHATRRDTPTRLTPTKPRAAARTAANHRLSSWRKCHYPPGTSKWNKIEHRLPRRAPLRQRWPHLVEDYCAHS